MNLGDLSTEDLIIIKATTHQTRTPGFTDKNVKGQSRAWVTQEGTVQPSPGGAGLRTDHVSAWPCYSSYGPSKVSPRRLQRSKYALGDFNNIVLPNHVKQYLSMN